jgi:hypothetical protein
MCGFMVSFALSLIDGACDAHRAKLESPTIPRREGNRTAAEICRKLRGPRHRPAAENTRGAGWQRLARERRRNPGARAATGYEITT